MGKNIKEYLSFYVYALFIISIYGYFMFDDWRKSYEPPIGIVVNMKGEIIEKSDKEKQLKQGAKFWQHQLVAVRGAINEPDEIIALNRASDEKRLERNSYKELSKESGKLALLAAEKEWAEMGVNIPNLRKVRAAEEEIKLKQEELERMKINHRTQARYDAALERQPALLELEKIITSILLMEHNK